MATITEDYVSFETAELLKEKGFDEYTAMVYNQNGSFMPNGAIEDTYQTFYSAPTIQMTMKWLREVHKAFISITYENDGVFTANLKAPLKEIDCMIDNKHNCWFKYEEAAEEAIKFCIENLI